MYDFEAERKQHMDPPPPAMVPKHHLERAGIIGFLIGLAVMWAAIHFQHKPRFEFYTITAESEGTKEPVIYRCDLLTGETEVSHYRGGGFVPVHETYDPHPMPQ